MSSYDVVRLSGSESSLPAMSFGDRFCMSKKGGTGEVGGCTKGANSMAVSMLDYSSTEPKQS